tara:strand:- start:410 stop:658 length:249 start_codon:yes stop_codon:yes gene_type:complete
MSCLAGRIPFGVFAICSAIGAILRPNAAYKNRGFVDIARNIGAIRSFGRCNRTNEPNSRLRAADRLRLARAKLELHRQQAVG